jgi:hypothetical protein
MGERDRDVERELLVSGKNVAGTVVSFMEEHPLARRFTEGKVKVRCKRMTTSSGLSARYTVDVQLYEWPWKQEKG